MGMAPGEHAVELFGVFGDPAAVVLLHFVIADADDHRDQAIVLATLWLVQDSSQ